MSSRSHQIERVHKRYRRPIIGVVDKDIPTSNRVVSGCDLVWASRDKDLLAVCGNELYGLDLVRFEYEMVTRRLPFMWAISGLVF